MTMYGSPPITLPIMLTIEARMATTYGHIVHYLYRHVFWVFFFFDIHTLSHTSQIDVSK